MCISPFSCMLQVIVPGYLSLFAPTDNPSPGLSSQKIESAKGATCVHEHGGLAGFDPRKRERRSIRRWRLARLNAGIEVEENEVMAHRLQAITDRNPTVVLPSPSYAALGAVSRSS